MNDSCQPVPDNDKKIIFLSDSLADLKEVGNWTLKRQSALFEKLIKASDNEHIIKCYKKIVKTLDTLNKSVTDIALALDVEFKKWALGNGYDKKTYEILCSTITKQHHEKNYEVCKFSQKNCTVKENDKILKNRNVEIVQPIEVVNNYLEKVTNKSDHKKDYDRHTEFDNIEVQNSKARTGDCSSIQLENVTLNGEEIEKPNEFSNTVLDTNQITENVFDFEKDMNDKRDEEKNNMENCEKHESSNMAEKIIVKDKISEVNKNLENIQEEKQKKVEKNASKKEVKKSKRKNSKGVSNDQVESDNRNEEIDEGEVKNDNCNDESKNESVVTENPKNVNHSIENKVDGNENKNKNPSIDDNRDEESKSTEKTETDGKNQEDKMKNKKTNEINGTDVELYSEKKKLKDKREKKVEFEKQGNKLQAGEESRNCEIDKNDMENIVERNKIKNKSEEIVEEEVIKGKKEFETAKILKDKSRQSQTENESLNCEVDKNGDEEVRKKEIVENKKQKDKKKSSKTNEKNNTENSVDLNEENGNSKDQDEVNFEGEVETHLSKESEPTKTKDVELAKEKTKTNELDEEGEKSGQDNSIIEKQNSINLVIDSSYENDLPSIDHLDSKEKEIKSEINNENTNVKIEVDNKVDTKIGIIKLVDISKLVDKVGFVLSPPRIEEPQHIPDKSKKRKSVSFLVEDSDSSDNGKKSKNKRAQIENITISSDSSDFEPKNEPKRSTTRKLRDTSKVTASKFQQLRKSREIKYKKRRISIESDSSDSDDSFKLIKEVKQNSRQKKQLKSTDKSDPKFYLPCSVVIEKSDLSKPEMYLKRHIDLKETKSIERLSNLSSLKKRKRNPKKASSDVGESISSDSETQSLKKTRPPQKKKSKGKSDSDEEIPLGNLKKKIDDDSDDGSNDDAPLKNLKNQADVPIKDFSEPERVDSSSDSESSSPENNKKKKGSSKQKSADKENKSDSDTEKNNGTDKKNDKKKENEDSEDSDFQKKKSWKKDKLLHGKLSESEEDEDKKNKSQKKKKRTRRVLGSDSEAHTDDGSDAEFEIKKNNKKKNSDESSEDSEDVAKKKKHRRIKEINDSDDSSENEYEDGEAGKRRKKIRAVLKDDLLSKTTRDAAKEEQERKKRISDRQKMYNEMYDLALENKAKVDKVVLDFDPNTKEELIKVHPDLVEKLKPHQANGVKFMWDACFESLEQTKKDKGSGCILAHCMGLGKTLQVVTLIHTLLTHKKTGVRTVMVVCPLSTVLNWVNEFKIWLDSINDGEDVNIFEISRYKKNYERAYQIKEWQECGGVLILGYEMFRLLSNDANKRIRKKNRDSLQSGLVDPGPDLVVCDEGHLLKNEKSRLSKAMNCLKTMRRIVLTGTPVQNNLREYYCMVQFVKPNLLGKYNEYTNRFVNPITNGQYTDSTPRDIAIMKRRSHVLHKLLDGVVQRRDYSVLAPFLPPKHEYVCFLTLTDIQKKLYKIYMDHQSKRAESGGKAVALFADFQALQRIWTHPRMLKAYSEKYEKDQEKRAILSDEEGSLVDFIDDDDDTSSSESEAVSTSDEKSNDSVQFKSKRKAPPKRRTRASAAQKANDDGSDSDVVQEIKPPNPTEWWCDYIKDDELDNLKYSAKLLLLFDILKKCELIGDKVLVFSQSLYSLDLIEYFLEKIDEATQNGESTESLAGHSASWALGLDYFRLDGSSSVENRAAWCKSFNDEDNPRARLFLISTKAGGLGINLVAANRVIIFDVSWNPSHDVQSIFRIYRFGQKKPCYVYRFIAMGTMEEKVYERQVTKQAISKRVIDEQQIDRHYNQNDLAELYKFTPEPEGERPIPMLPKDRMFAELLQEHENLIYRYHEHDSLLENKEEEELDEDERRAAWDEFENEKTAKPATGLMGSMIRPSMTPEQAAYALEVMLRNEHPSWNDIQIRQMVPAILQQMYQQAIAGDWTLYNRVMSYQVTLQQQIMAAQTRLMNPALQTVIAANQKAKESQWAAMVKRMQMGAANRPSTSKDTRPAPAPRARPFDPNEVVNLD